MQEILLTNQRKIIAKHDSGFIEGDDDSYEADS